MIYMLYSSNVIQLRLEAWGDEQYLLRLSRGREKLQIVKLLVQTVQPSIAMNSCKYACSEQESTCALRSMSHPETHFRTDYLWNVHLNHQQLKAVTSPGLSNPPTTDSQQTSRMKKKKVHSRVRPHNYLQLTILGLLLMSESAAKMTSRGSSLRPCRKEKKLPMFMCVSYL